MNQPAAVVSPVVLPNLEIPTLSEFEQMLSGVAAPTFKEFGIESFENRSKKHVRLVGNRDTNKSLASKSEWLSYDLNEISYISSIRLSVEGLTNGDEFKLSYVDSFSKLEKIIEAELSEGVVNFPVGKFVQGFGLHTPYKIFKTAKITSVEVSGIAPSELTSLVREFGNVARLKDKVKEECSVYLNGASEANTQKVATEKTIELRQTELNKADELIAERTRELAETDNVHLARISEIDKLTNAIVEKQQNLLSVDDQVEKKSEERKLINQQVTAAHLELAELRRDIHLFPSEISGYVRQGSWNVYLYAALCAIPFIVIILVTYKLFSNAEILTGVFLQPNRPPIAEYLLSRAPYALVSAVILAVCYSLLHRLFGEIVSINRKKQDLFKISIIATDVSFASAKGLNASDEEAYNLLTETKMELLKEHLRQHLSEYYKYKKQGGPVEALLELFRKKTDHHKELDGVEAK